MSICVKEKKKKKRCCLFLKSKTSIRAKCFKTDFYRSVSFFLSFFFLSHLWINCWTLLNSEILDKLVAKKKQTNKQNKTKKHLRLNTKKCCLKAPTRIHFCLRVRLSWNGRFIFFLLLLLLFFYFFYFFLFCQKRIWKIKMQIITTHSIWQQPSLAPTPQPVLSSFPWYTNKLCGTTVISTSRKIEKKKTHSVSVFETPESFETEHYISSLTVKSSPLTMLKHEIMLLSSRHVRNNPEI